MEANSSTRLTPASASTPSSFSTPTYASTSAPSPLTGCKTLSILKPLPLHWHLASDLQSYRQDKVPVKEQGGKVHLVCVIG